MRFIARSSILVVAVAYVATAAITKFQPEFDAIVNTRARIRTVASRNDVNFAHEGPVYMSRGNQLIFTSNRQTAADGTPFIEISSLDLATNKVTVLNPQPAITMANGAYKVDDRTIAFCSQGLGNQSATVVELDIVTLKTRVVVDKWFDLGFSSLNDIIKVSQNAQNTQGWMFTDPPYGFAQKFRTGEQELAPKVWYYERTQTGDVVKTDLLQPVADQFVKPNGLCLSPDGSIVYVSDSGFATGEGSKTDVNLPRSIYAYDLVMTANPNRRNASIPSLRNRRLFASSDTGIPDGMKVDTLGNLYVGAGGGVHVYNKYGVIIGKILTPSGESVANLAFVGDTLYMLAETDIFAVQLKVSGAVTL